MLFNRTVIMPATTMTTAALTPVNLPVNPISHLVVTMRFLNVTDEATLAQILARLASIQVLWNGQAIHQYSADDLFRLNMRLLKTTPLGGNQVATDNAARFISFIVPFSPQPYNPKFGIPATKSGQLTLAIVPSTSEAEADNCVIIVEAVEMLGASPEKTLKITTINPPSPSVGDNDVLLPREGELLGIQAFGTTVPTSTAFTKTINSLILLVNNTPQYVTLGNWEALRGEASLTHGQEKGWVTADGIPNDDNYIYIDLDPLKDQSYLLATDSLNDLMLKVNAGDTNPYRFVLARLVPSARYAANP